MKGAQTLEKDGDLVGAKKDKDIYLIKHIRPLIHNHVPTKYLWRHDRLSLGLII